MKARSASFRSVLIQSTFDEQRERLFGLAYRMLGSAADADDIVQETWLRWQRAEGVDQPAAWLTTVATRISIDRLRELKRARETYVGPWLPEPLVSPPADRLELAESLSMAFLTLLEKLSPAERAVFLLRQVFGYGYAEIAAIVEVSEANARQLFSRARKHVDEGRPRFDASPNEQRRLLGGFVKALEQGDMDALVGLLKEDIAFWSDGGGKVAAAMRPLLGARSVAAFFMGVTKFSRSAFRVEFANVNGEVGLLLYENDVLNSVFSVGVLDGRIAELRVVRNPDKLARAKSA